MIVTCLLTGPTDKSGKFHSSYMGNIIEYWECNFKIQFLILIQFKHVLHFFHLAESVHQRPHSEDHNKKTSSNFCMSSTRTNLGVSSEDRGVAKRVF